MDDIKLKSGKKMSTPQTQLGASEEAENPMDVEDEEFPDETEEAEEERESETVEGETELDCLEEVEKKNTSASTVGRTVTLQMLLESNLLQPGQANMSIEYLGQRFIGDLLSDGKIKSLETDIIFASPSAWASHCKRIINPDKKSGCGWASVKYLGQKLDVFKNKYFKLKAMEQEGKEQESPPEEEDVEVKQALSDTPKVPVKHQTLGNRNNLHDMKTLVECVPFSSVGKIQPFLVSMSTNAALVLDFHCHLTTSEVVGYLAGHWDVNAHNLAITAALPCRSRLNDRELGPLVEEDIMRNLESRRLTLVGWYHSHPTAPPLPTLKDIDSQLEYEIRMKGSSDASYIPCVGLICSPYHEESMSLESAVSCYWVIPPPENKPLEYGKPMTMTYSLIQDQFLSQDSLNEMKKCAEFYRNDQDFVKFNEKYKDNITYLEKLKASVSGKFPREQNDGLIWSCLSDIISGGSSSTMTPLPQPITVPTPSTAPTQTVPISVPTPPTSSTSMPPAFSLASADLATALLASAKFQPPPGLLSSLPAPKLPPPPPLSSSSTS